MSTAKTEVAKAAQNSTLPQVKKLSDFEKLLVPYQLKIEQVAPKKGLQAARIVNMAAQIIWMNPKLHNCSPQSILAAVMQAAMNGLNPSPQFQEVYFIPYGDQCQLQLGYRGYIKLCSKSAMVQAFRADAVYEGDEFEFELGMNYDLKHKPGPNYGDAKKVTHAYAIAYMNSGKQQFVVLPKIRLERLRVKNKMQQANPSGAWATDYDQMAIAKAFKQLLKFIPLEDEYRSATFIDENIASLDQVNANGDVEYNYEQSTEFTPVEILKNETELTEDQKNQAALEAQLAKEAGTLPFDKQ